MKVLLRSVVILLLLSIMPHAEAQRRHPTTRREAVGNERATQIESILQALRPGMTVVWSPELAVRDSSGSLTPVDVHDIKTAAEGNGGRAGIVAIDIGSGKKQYIERFRRGLPASPISFETEFVLFHVDASNQVTNVRTVPLQTGDSVTKIVSYEILRWPAGGSPVLGVSYDSFIVNDGAATTISWGSQYDIGNGSFLTRLPTGIVIRQSNGQETEDIISVNRTSPSTIQLVGAMSKQAVTYQCSDPCIVDTQTFLAIWPK